MTPASVRVIGVLMLIIALALTGCRRADSRQPTALPTLTPTPRSTPLPALDPTAIPGAADNPIRVVVVGDASENRRQNAADNLAEALSEASGLTIAIELVPTTADAVSALCGSFGGTPTAVWLDGLGYAAARACGTPALWLERGSGRDASPFETIQFIVPEDSEVTGAAGLAGADMCRVGLTDYTTWRAPLLLLHAGRLDPRNLGTITEVATAEDLIAEVAAGTCSAGVSAREFDEFATGANRTAVRVLSATAEIPHGILMYPLEVPLGARLTLNDAILDLDTNRDFDLVFAATGISPIPDEGLDDFHRFLTSTGLDFEQLGS